MLFELRASPRRSIVASCDMDGRPTDDRGGMDPRVRPDAGLAGGCQGQPHRASALRVLPARCPPAKPHRRRATGCRCWQATTLIARLEADSLIAGIRAHSHASADNFQRHYAPVIDRALEFAQLLPASESHHHAQPGGMALHSLETALHALKRRQGLMLPPGAPTETQQRAQHRWTYAVFLAALLHDTGKAAHDLRITYDSAAQSNAVWNPLVGSLLELAATSYRVDFAHTATRSYAAHRRFPLVLLPKFVPAPVLGWLAEEGTLLQELADYLCGERRDGALAELVGAGDRESVRRNLLTGPRQRFAAARTAPLIERLMEALRRMLADGAWLPLNRDGAAGWVAEDAVWFVSKRLADEVRRFLQAQGDHAVPGEDKNDRLFDVWQEYGALIPNPATGGAIWRARVEGADYAHELTLLRFPLTRLYPEATRFPAAMQGRIVVLPATGCRPRDRRRGARAGAGLAVSRHAWRPAGPIVAAPRPVRLPTCSTRSDDAATLEPCPSSASSSRLPVPTGHRSVTSVARSPSQTAFRARHGVHGLGAARGGRRVALLQRKRSAGAFCGRRIVSRVPRALPRLCRRAPGNAERRYRQCQGLAGQGGAEGGVRRGLEPQGAPQHERAALSGGESRG